jgi:hypothetical protein
VEWTENAEEIRKPYHNADHDNAIQDRLDAGLHWNETVHKR